jgi:hypothetical protein
VMYKIVNMFDVKECETCGNDYAEGYQIFKDGKLVVDKTPRAHCYNGKSYPQEYAFVDILHLEAIEFTVEDED